MCVQLGNCIFSVLMNAGRSSPLVSLSSSLVSVFPLLFHLLSFPLTVKAAYYNLYSRVLLEGDIWWPQALLQHAGGSQN